LEGKMIGVRDVSVKEAPRMIDQHLSKNPGAHYVSELAEELELDVAFKAAATFQTGSRWSRERYTSSRRRTNLRRRSSSGCS